MIMMSIEEIQDRLDSIDTYHQQEQRHYQRYNYLSSSPQHHRQQQQQQQQQQQSDEYYDDILDDDDIQIDVDCRMMMIDWFHEVIHFGNLEDTVVEICIEYMDRFLSQSDHIIRKHQRRCGSTSIIAFMDRNVYQLMCMTCLYVACKMHATKALDLSLMSLLSRRAYTTKQFESMEIIVYHTLQYYLNPPTVSLYIHAYVDLIFPHDHPWKEKIIVGAINYTKRSIYHDPTSIAKTSSRFAYEAIRFALHRLIMKEESHHNRNKQTNCYPCHHMEQHDIMKRLLCQRSHYHSSTSIESMDNRNMEISQIIQKILSIVVADVDDNSKHIDANSSTASYNNPSYHRFMCHVKRMNHQVDSDDKATMIYQLQQHLIQLYQMKDKNDGFTVPVGISSPSGDTTTTTLIPNDDNEGNMIDTVSSDDDDYDVPSSIELSASSFRMNDHDDDDNHKQRQGKEKRNEQSPNSVILFIPQA